VHRRASLLRVQEEPSIAQSLAFEAGRVLHAQARAPQEQLDLSKARPRRVEAVGDASAVSGHCSQALCARE
jgi:hypothetical protein